MQTKVGKIGGKSVAEKSAKKEWLQPELRKLPIAATSGENEHNEGQGGGKGSSGPFGS